MQNPPPPAEPAADAPRVSFVSLGCPKALVDSERILTRLRAEGYELSRTHAGADVVVVNTCGFLDSAKAESLEAIGAALKENGKVVVTGCMGAEPQAITDRFPQVTAITGPQAYESVVEAVHAAAPPRRDPFLDLVPEQGVKLTPRHYAYLKISEGCDNSCSFCIIPHLRGPLASRPAAEVLREAEKLVKAGVKELLVISQDTSAYGRDLRYAESAFGDRAVRARFLDLSRELGSLGAWVRLHYVYPYPHVDEVVALMAEGKVLPYLDIPFQHAAPSVLKTMKRPANEEKTLERIKAWRRICPDLTLRSTFIVGFPGETEADFCYLLDWLDEAEIDRAGAFRYEPVAGAPANDLPLEAVPDEVKETRWKRFMERQQKVSARLLKRKIGKRLQVLIDEPGGGASGALAKGRSKADAPQIDGAVNVASRRPLRAGDIVTVKIERADAYDLHGVAV
ncbi:MULTISPECIES: 30S ribosomal protein S12 methylthiotransferase RimO [Methylosinus]|uniref:Ribosomal protein uS12 methylthiotransferase RimO n=1 Tax=Methylosinus trichosporium (strain ATCC 35070 / NCIMB 11131 / UNIQEM 75 / OB3b) TaxID=595536 RepID=A0A2D2D2F5_METT3|nr:MULTISPECIES: 30S ribosomal protein S12 methylthiotransferase RimO [Methylosinus]ATQ69165.1 30S ribosomal protein S12 methylthiotransferase RimO [Methylosinus trichosporium OB3b]OBS53589.1 ribosomal protein S12 methylthiotransferase [Methylosinus sp. 3S-1]